MTDLYEPKAPFRAERDDVFDANGEAVAEVPGWVGVRDPDSPLREYDARAFAARIAAALNAEDRVRELEAFRALVASMTLEGEEDDYRGGPFKPDHADQHETLEYLIRQARNLVQERPDADTAD